jgi:hypothetical protein
MSNNKKIRGIEVKSDDFLLVSLNKWTYMHVNTLESQCKAKDKPYALDCMLQKERKWINMHIVRE